MLIGERLIDLRKDMGLTQRELSEKLFVNALIAFMKEIKPKPVMTLKSSLRNFIMSA